MCSSAFENVPYTLENYTVKNVVICTEFVIFF